MNDKVNEIVESLNKAFDELDLAGKTIKDQGQYVVVNLLWLVSEGHTVVMPKLLTRFEHAVRRLKLERKGFEAWVHAHVPLKKNKDGEWEPVGLAARKVMAKNRKKFREDYDSDYWMWVTDHVKVEKKEPDWVQRLDSAIKSALDENKGGMSQQDLIRHIIKEQGLDITTLVSLLNPEMEVVMEDAA